MAEVLIPLPCAFRPRSFRCRFIYRCSIGGRNPNPLCTRVTVEALMRASTNHSLVAWTACLRLDLITQSSAWELSGSTTTPPDSQNTIKRVKTQSKDLDDSCSVNWKIWNHFLDIMNLSACHAVCKLAMESGANWTGQTFIHIWGPIIYSKMNFNAFKIEPKNHRIKEKF